MHGTSTGRRGLQLPRSCRPSSSVSSCCCRRPATARRAMPAAAAAAAPRPQQPPPSHTTTTTTSSSSSSSPEDQRPQLPCRRAVLSALLLTAASAAAPAATTAGPPAAAAAAAAGGPRQLTPEQQAAVDAALAKVVNKAKAPVVLRLAYHDAGTFSKAQGDGGPNASIQFELARPENFGLKRGWGVVQQAMQALKGTAAEGVVSYADLVALAGAYAVAITGGPAIAVPVGRLDALAEDPPGRMASEQSSAQALKDNFAAKGFSVRELVALSGAHTIGGKGFGDALVFDNAYYASLLNKPWLNAADPMSTHIGLPSDHVLPDDPECRPIIQEYAADVAAFHRDFAAAYQKMSVMGAVFA